MHAACQNGGSAGSGGLIRACTIPAGSRSRCTLGRTDRLRWMPRRCRGGGTASARREPRRAGGVVAARAYIPVRTRYRGHPWPLPRHPRPDASSGGFAVDASNAEACWPLTRRHGYRCRPGVPVGAGETGHASVERRPRPDAAGTESAHRDPAPVSPASCAPTKAGRRRRAFAAGEAMARSPIEATTRKPPEDVVARGYGASGTWMCHDPSTDRTSARGGRHTPGSRRPRPVPRVLARKSRRLRSRWF